MNRLLVLRYYYSTDCIKIQEQPNLNQTLCSYIKSFRLPSEYYVTVCRYGNRTLIDIHQLLHQKCFTLCQTMDL